MRISKSNYVAACQCEKMLWLKKYRNDLAEIDESTQRRFDIGTTVGEFAQDLFPGGVKIVYDYNTSVMVEKTRDLLAQGQCIIYEAAFIVDNLIAICDILVKRPSGFAVYEVKSSTKLSEAYLIDTAFQYYVLKRAGLLIEEINVVYINTQYVRQGPIDLNQLFAIDNVTEEAKARQNSIAASLSAFWAVLAQSDEPDKDIGPQCSTPYECSFHNHCWQHVPEISVFNLYKMQSKKKFEFYDQKIISYEDLAPCKSSLSPIQQMQIDAELNDQTFINSDGIRSFIRSLKFPLNFLDFETFQQAIPQFDGVRPYEQIPFQYSLHMIESEYGPLQHREFLGQEGTNPKRQLAEHLVADISEDVCILAYHASFERSVIDNLASEFPDLAHHLNNIRDHVHDLEIPFKSGHYYVKAMNGSFSIKYVLPALFPDDLSLDYHSLAIQNGDMANQIFATLHLRSPEEIEGLRNNLLDYCRLDTLAMVRIWEKLREV